MRVAGWEADPRERFDLPAHALGHELRTLVDEGRVATVSVGQGVTHASVSYESDLGLTSANDLDSESGGDSGA
jgi:hypothetical protein